MLSPAPMLLSAATRAAGKRQLPSLVASSAPSAPSDTTRTSQRPSATIARAALVLRRIARDRRAAQMFQFVQARLDQEDAGAGAGQRVARAVEREPGAAIAGEAGDPGDKNRRARRAAGCRSRR